MDPWTLEEIVDTFNTAGAMILVGAGFIATAGAGIVIAGKIKRRYELVEHYKDPCYKDRLKVKPNIFNIRRIASNNPEYKNKYWVRRKSEEKYGQRAGL